MFPGLAFAERMQDPFRMMVTLPPDYRPSEDEEFMNPLQVEFFRQKLLRWRADLLREANGTLASLSEGGIHESDITDRASGLRRLEARPIATLSIEAQERHERMERVYRDD
jgi:DnaK suppressor protein